MARKRETPPKTSETNLSALRNEVPPIPPPSLTWTVLHQAIQQHRAIRTSGTPRKFVAASFVCYLLVLHIAGEGFEPPTFGL
jgi:hypothetical protein